jgi:hypothetical protein
MINHGKIVFDGPTTDLGSNEVEMEEKFRSLTSGA